MGKAQSKSMNVTPVDQAKTGAVAEEGAGKVGKIEESPAAAATATEETVRSFIILLTSY